MNAIAALSPYSSSMGKSNTERHTLSVLVDNEPGVLARGRPVLRPWLQYREPHGCRSCACGALVAHHHRHDGLAEAIEQIGHQLERIVPIHKVTDLTVRGRAIERELAMIKVRGKGENRVEALRLAEAFKAKVIDATLESFIFELTGAPAKIDDFVELMRPLGLVELSRTGVAAIARGSEAV